MQQITPPAASTPPAPELDWLEIALEQGRAWLDQGTERWRRLWLALPTLGRPLQPAPALAGLMNEMPISLPSYQGTTRVAPPEAHFELQLIVVPDPADPDLGRLEVALTLKDRFGDFSGVQVTLLWDDTAQRAVTDAQGEVVFTGLPLDQLPSMRLLVTFPG
jgi:hypothetical protein